MIEIQDFITERGGDPEKIRESQRRRYESAMLSSEAVGTNAKLADMHRWRSWTK
jgi:hypothetical protein